MDEVTISVVIPTCDRPNHLRAAIDSVLNQTVQPTEIIVVDNGLTAVESSEFPLTVTIQRVAPRIGASRARNIGVNTACSQYVAFLDDDDTWATDYLETMIEAIGSCPTRPQCLLGRRDMMVNGHQTVYKCVQDIRELIPALLYSNPGVGGQSMVVCRRAFQQLGGFDETLVTAEDRALVLEFILAGTTVVCVPSAVAVIGHHSGERLTDTTYMLQGRKQFIKKYRYLMGITEWLAAQHKVVRLYAQQNRLYRLPEVGLRLLRHIVPHLPMRAVRKLDSWASGNKTNASVRLDGVQFSEFSPLKKIANGHALNKAGRLVLSGMGTEHPVKIYESASEEHARFIQAVSNHDSIARYFPDVHEVYGRFVVTKWVDNTNAATPTPKIMASLLHQIHTTEAKSLPHPGFDYWHDFIKPRFLRAVDLMRIECLSEEIIAKVEHAWHNSFQRLMHPDVTIANMICTANNQWKIIDNELLSIGGLPLLDVCNTASALKPEDRKQFLSLYLEMTKTRIGQHEIDVLSAAWLARIIGSAFLTGDVIKMKRILMRYKSGQEILPLKFKPTHQDENVL